MSHDTFITLIYALIFGVVIFFSWRQYRRIDEWHRQQEEAVKELERSLK